LPRIYSLTVLVAVWAVAAAIAHSQLLPGPVSVSATILAEIRSGELPFQMGCTLARVTSSFAIAMALGIFAGYAMGRSKIVDRYADPWLVVLINLPALVTIIFAYIWIGLTETAAILAVALNKLPNVIVVVRDLTDPSRRHPATRAISGRQFAFRPLDRLEDRARGRVDRTPERRRVRTRLGLLAVRHGQDPELFDLLHRPHARDRKPSGTAA
jgi:hypothetical protein